ncbi:outer membrane protein assembly factor BamE [Rhodophyticola sp. CCM32]|uniref:outer membrane protein assembly factor BamE n=1 Tax=Rhodophyticola sp. CCM32 TaxID=2916397 RepID=UPI00107FBA63|nr:outer membrane protein assembly factor BamE [Rhodophyticola sp. CCM32]QBY00751.1 outer membrane protein assembly factor BamE [Rhodophyticola sp. CCM32]
MVIGQNSPIWQRLRLGLAALAVCGAAGCAATFNNHGYIPPEEELTAIVPGVDTRESLETSIGTPGAAGVMRDEAWFYTDYRVRNFIYRAPQITERNIIAVSFDDEGVVQNIERFGLEDGQVVRLSRRVTDGGIEEVTLLRQILQNFGRIDVASILGADN